MQNGFLDVPFNNVKLQNQSVKEELMEAISSVLDSNQVLDGPHREELEANIAQITGRKHAIVTHSGTAALGIISKAFYQPNRYVDLPAVSFIATANAFKNDGWRLSFYNNLNVSVISQDVALIVGVGLFGKPCYMSTMGVPYVEDACQSWLASPWMQPYSSRHTQVISFDPTKNIAGLGNGGAIATDDEILSRFVRKYINHGKGPDGFGMVGMNLRMSELECATLNVKLKHMESWQQRRRAIAMFYLNEFANTPQVETVMKHQDIWNHGLQKFVISVPGEDRDALVAYLSNRGIECKIHYEKTMFEYGFLNDFEDHDAYYLRIHDELKTTMAGWLSLPFYPELTADQMHHVVNSVDAYFSEKN